MIIAWLMGLAVVALNFITAIEMQKRDVKPVLAGSVMCLFGGLTLLTIGPRIPPAFWTEAGSWLGALTVVAGGLTMFIASKKKRYSGDSLS